MNHRVAGRIKRPQAGRIFAIVAQLPIGRIFDQIDLHASRPAPNDFDQSRAPLGRDGYAAGIVVIGSHVDHFDKAQFVGPFQSGQFPIERLGNDPMLVTLDAPCAGSQAVENAQEHEIGRLATEHDIARVEERVGDQGEQLVAACRDHDLLDREVQFLGGSAVGVEHAAQHGFAQREVADGGAILQRGLCPSRIGPEDVHRLTGRLDG